MAPGRTLSKSLGITPLVDGRSTSSYHGGTKSAVHQPVAHELCLHKRANNDKHIQYGGLTLDEGEANSVNESNRIDHKRGQRRNLREDEQEGQNIPEWYR